jgi:predicted nuclease of predicted toxin-antitoxin system
MKIKVDENLPTEVARVLEDAGHDASTTVAEGLGGATDEVLLAKTLSEGRVLLTLDVGFGDIRLYPPADYPGIVVLRLERHDREHLLAMARRLTSLFERESVDKRLWVVSEGRVRIRE